MFILRSSRIAFSAIVLQVCLITAHSALAVDLPPQVDLNGAAAGTNATATFTEDAGAVSLCPNATLTDDGSIITALLLSMTPHPEGMDEVLSAVALAGMAVTYNRGDGEMLINGTASAAVYQQVLRTLTYVNLSNTPTPTTRVVKVVAYDANTSSTPRTIQVSVVPVNDAPVVDLNGAAAGINRSLTFTEGGGAVSVAPAALVTDPDSSLMTSITLKLSSIPNGSAESLTATGGGGVSVSYNSSAGILMLTGSALPASYQTVLRSVAYNNTAASPDPTTRTLTVTVWDSSRASGWATARIGIVQVNRAPTGITPASMSVAENSAVGTVVGTLQTQDPNTSDTHAYSFVAPNGNAGGKFLISGDKILVAGPLNYESGASATITVKSTDPGDLNFTADITVNILNINEAPTWLDMAKYALSKNTLANDQMAGSFVASDPDAGEAFTYSFTTPNGDNGGRFKISGDRVLIANAAQIKADSVIDYPVTCRVTDHGGLSYTRDFTFQVPVNQSPIVDLNGGSQTGMDRSLTFTEGGGAATIAPEALVLDPDGTQLTSMTLTLAARPNGSAETLSATAGGGVSVSYNSSTGALLLSGLATTLNYQTVLRSAKYNNDAALPDTTTRTLTATGWDTFGSSNIPCSARIGVRQINRAPTGISPATMSIAENSAVGTVVGTTSATDPNAGDTHTFAFALPYANGGKFSISGNAIKVASAIDYETTKSVTVTVKATDKGGLSATRNIAVSILDVNETPTSIQLAAATLSKLHIANETAAGTLSATDPDAGQTLTYTFTSPGNNCGGRFKIVGNQLRIANAAQIKADAQVDYAVSVRVTDQGGLTSAKDLTVHIAKANAAGHWIIYK